jgi:NTP pyrophosphatase (non-canonical NTP hydrolase)
MSLEQCTACGYIRERLVFKNDGRCPECSQPLKGVDSGITLKRLQAEIAPWEKHNFGDRPAWHPLLGVLEELGELSHAFLKRAQGIRGTPEKHAADIRDACADLIIFLCDFATTEGIDLDNAVTETWARVKQRDWKKNPQNGMTIDEESFMKP